MKQPWQAKIIHKNKDINLIFPEECVIIKDTIEEVLRELLTKKHKAFYEIEKIVLERHY